MTKKECDNLIKAIHKINGYGCWNENYKYAIDDVCNLIRKRYKKSLGVQLKNPP